MVGDDGRVGGQTSCWGSRRGGLLYNVLSEKAIRNQVVVTVLTESCRTALIGWTIYGVIGWAYLWDVGPEGAEDDVEAAILLLNENTYDAKPKIA